MLATDMLIPKRLSGSISNSVTVPAFYPILPGVSSHYGMLIHSGFSVHFQLQYLIVANHSWGCFIYSIPTRYGGNQPFAI